jgi:hypothetical protein
MRRRYGPIAVLYITGCSAAAGETGSTRAIPPVVRVVNSIRVTVDPRVQLMSIAQEIGAFRDSQAFLLTRDSSAYRHQVQQAFSKYRNHRAVKMVADLSKTGFSFSRPPFVMLHLDDTLEIRTGIVPDALAMKLSGGEESVRELAREMARFREESRFAAFYEEHRPFYARLVDEVAKNLGEHDYVREIESFYGAGRRRYSLVLVALYGPVGFGPDLTLRDGGREVFNILGPSGVIDGIPNFARDSDYFKYMQRHEFSHSFVNPLATRNRPEVERLAPLFQKMPEVALKSMCGDWEECLNEQVVRAVTTYLAYGDGEAAGDGALQSEKKRGAVLVDELLAGVRDYAAARDRYSTFESYYPVLLRRLEALLK